MKNPGRDQGVESLNNSREKCQTEKKTKQKVVVEQVWLRRSECVQKLRGRFK